VNSRLGTSASPYLQLSCIFSNNSQKCIQKHLKHQTQRHADRSSAATNTRPLLGSVTCVLVITISISIEERRKPTQPKGTSPCLRTHRAGIHPPAAPETRRVARGVQATPDFGADAVFYNYCKHQLDNGSKILFPSSLASKWGWHHRSAGAPMSAATVPGGCSQLGAARPAQPPAGGKTWPTSTPQHSGHPPTRRWSGLWGWCFIFFFFF